MTKKKIGSFRKADDYDTAAIEKVQDELENYLGGEFDMFEIESGAWDKEFAKMDCTITDIIY